MRRALLVLPLLLAVAAPAHADRLVTIDVRDGARTVVAQTRTFGWLGSPCWAADGSLVLRREGPGDRDHYVAYGSRTRVLEPAPYELLDTLFAPGCDRVAEFIYAFDGASGGGGVQIRDAGGPPRRRLRSIDFSDAPLLAWARDGSRLAVIDWERRRGLTLRVVDADGRVLRRRATVSPDLTPEAFAPDGRSLAYVDPPRVNGFERLHVLDVATGARRTLLGGRSVERAAAWSPDGTCIAVVTYDQEPGVTLVDVASGATTFIPIADLLVEDLRWSPDGRQLAVSYTRTERDHGVALLPLDPPGPLRRLVSTRRIFAEPSWSPDGTRLALVLDDDARSR